MLSTLWSNSADAHAQNLFPVSSRYEDGQILGQLEAKDTEWLCASSGFTTETQIFYVSADDGTFVMCQVIHSAVGLWYPTVQFIFKFHNPKTGETAWKSVNVSNFVTPPPGLDKRSSKADGFSITYKATSNSDYPESYTIDANLGVDLQFSLEVPRPTTVPGFKIGNDSRGGCTYFGPDAVKPEGYVVHRFWPHFIGKGHFILHGKFSEFRGPGMFVHSIQGMRPNLVASSWNFADFQSEAHGGVSAIQMEFKTCSTHGKKGSGSGGVVVNIGSLVVGGKLVAVTAETNWPDEPAKGTVVSRATHLDSVPDSDTGHEQPKSILFEWQGPSVVAESPGSVQAKLHVDVFDGKENKGLIEKVDVLGEIPYAVKKAVSYIAGAKPYIYQYINPTVLSITGPEAILPGLSEGLEVHGTLFNEATFISS